MRLAPSNSLPRRADPTVREISRAWRRLTGGTDRGVDPARRTLIACSGGADSCGLLLALTAAVSEPSKILVVGHIVHDLRPESESLEGANVAQSLAVRLGIPFVIAGAKVKGRAGNPESNARQERYRQLARLAQETGCPFIATAHHEDDQLESVLMALVRGSGPRGLAGIASARSTRSLTIIRPSLAVAPVELRRLCGDCGVTWSEDQTNADQTRLRAALRTTVLPMLKSIRPRAAASAARSAAVLRDAAAVVADRARLLLTRAAREGPDLIWPRKLLRRERAVTLGCLVKLAAEELVGNRGQDRLGAESMSQVLAAIRSVDGASREFIVGPIQIVVGDANVHIRGR